MPKIIKLNGIMSNGFCPNIVHPFIIKTHKIHINRLKYHFINVNIQLWCGTNKFKLQ